MKFRRGALLRERLSELRVLSGHLGCAAVLAILGCAVGSDATAQTYAVRAGRIYPVSSSSDAPEVIVDGMLLVSNGKILAVGSELTVPPGVRIRDFSSAVIVPGLVAASSNFAGSANGRESVGAQYRAVDAFDPFEKRREILGGGVTTAHISPGRRRLLSGQGAVVKVAPFGDAEAAVLRDSSDLCVNFTVEALRPPALFDIPIPSSWDQIIRPAEVQMPRTRMGRIPALDDWLDRARRPLPSYGVDVPRHESLVAFKDALKRRMRFRLEARDSADIRLAVRWLKDRRFRGYLALGDESYQVLDLLDDAELSVVLEVPGRFNSPDDNLGLGDLVIEPRTSTARELDRRGIPFALTTPQDVSCGQLLLFAGLAVADGLSPRRALEALTSRPARILGVADRVGSLEPGKDADFVVLTGDPFASTTTVARVYIDGQLAFKRTSRATVVRAETVLIGDGTEVRNGAVLVEEGKITAVGRTVPHPPGAQVFDGGPGSYLTPGFIDGHGHLGLGRDRTATNLGVPIWRTVGVAREDFLRASASGVTTVMLAPYFAGSQGSQIAAIKTYGKTREDLIARPLAGLFFQVSRTLDPLASTKRLAGALKSGKAYYDKWKKYEADLKKWEEEQAKKTSEEKGAEKPEEKKSGSEMVEETVEVVDPVSGKWDCLISGGPIPEPQSGTMYLKLEEAAISGKIKLPFGEEAEVTGTLSGNKVTLEIDVDTPMGAPVLEAEIDREDHMIGKVKLGPIALDFEATRTEREIAEIKVTRRKKKKGTADGRPEAPETKRVLEPYRDLFDGKVSVLVQVDLAPQIKQVIELLKETYKVSFVILNAAEGDRLSSTIKEAESGVVLPATIVSRRPDEIVVPAVELSRAGVSVAFQSDVEDGVRSLRSNALFAVNHGMDSTEALKALTIGPARLYKIDDRVGSLQVGKDGDMILFSGPPLESTSRIRLVLVNGMEVGRP